MLMLNQSGGRTRLGRTIDVDDMKRFGKAERRALKRTARELEYDKVNPNIFREIDLAIDEREASEVMARTRRMIA